MLDGRHIRANRSFDPRGKPSDHGAVRTGADRAAADTAVVAEAEITSTASDAVGSRWMLCAVTEADATTDTTDIERLAWMDLRADGRAIAFDGVNAINGSYQLTPSGFAARGGPTTLVGYVGDNPVQLMVIRAIAAVFDCTLSPDAEPTQVTARLIAGSLTLSVPPFTLDLRRVGPAGS